VRAASVRLRQNIGFLVALVANVGFGSVLFVVLKALRSSAFHVDAWAVGIHAVGGVFSSYRGRRGVFRTVHIIGLSRARAIQNSSPVFAFTLVRVFLGRTLRVPGTWRW
jgi:hypothetical protein